MSDEPQDISNLTKAVEQLSAKPNNGRREDGR